MSAPWAYHLAQAGFSEGDLARLHERCNGVLRSPLDIKRTLESFAYDYAWQANYQVQSALMSCRSRELSCINAAILAYVLLSGMPGWSRVLLAVHRRDPKDVQCGHVVALGEREGEVYAFGKSNYLALCRVYGPYPNRMKVAEAIGRAYMSMRFTPLYFGFFVPEVHVSSSQLVAGEASMNDLSDWMTSNYQYAFDTTQEII